ncbi:MAG: hypothetical protein DCC71_07060 [Proteobacteria bacterium]|nr:MAG: hypothetical protein DCC71_07060 [Pseudomonadota bacterium]
MTRSESFSEKLPRSGKTARGRTDATLTPLAIRSRIPLDDAQRERFRDRVARKLAKYATHIERLSLRLDDVNGPRGGADTVCKIKAVLSGLPSVVVEERGADADALVVRAAGVMERTLRRQLQRLGRSAPRATGGKRSARTPAPGVRPIPEDDGSLIGRRVGRGRDALERVLARPEKRRRDVYVDTAAPGTSASDRRVGYGATARRNTRRSGELTSALEDSRTTPSRKSTRKSHDRSRPSAPMEHNEALQRVTPKANATRARAARRGKRPR